MKNSFKKILSVIMACAMLATMIPTFALTAFADEAPSGNKSEYSYFVSGLDGVTQNNVNWDGGASFEGNGYAKLNNTPLSAVTASSGFIISMDVYNTDNALAKKFFNFKNGSNRISVESGSPDWWTRYRTEISNGSNTRGYYTSDFTSDDYCTVKASGSGNDSFPVNEWYNLTLVMNTDGSYSYYRNYELLATYKSNYISTGNGGGLTDEAAANAIASATDYIIGAADESATNGYTGKIKNLRIFATAEAKALQLAMINYENKMAQGKIYKNMSAAYNAYVAANKGFDAYIYGGDTSVNIASLASTLETATNNMTEWSAYTGTVGVKLANYDADSSYYNKVLYASSTTNFSDEGSCGNLRFKSYVPAVVVMYYDGVASTGTPKFPAGFEIKRANNSNRSCAFCYVSSSNNTSSSDTSDSNFGFTGRWIGYSTTWSNGVPWNTYGTSENFGGTYGSNYNQQVSWTNSRYYINKMEYKQSTSYKNSNTIYYTLYNQERGAYNSIVANCSRYVVNYAQVKEAISSKSSYLSRVESYKQGGMSTLLSRYDAATNYNITSYFSGATDSTISNFYDSAEHNAATVSSTLSSTAAPTADSDDYATLRTYLSNGLNTKSFDDVEGGRALTAQEIYNNSSINGDVLAYYDEFAAAYENAVAHMAAIPANDYGHTTVASKTAAALASDLSEKYNALQKKSNLEAPTISLFHNQEYLGINDEVNIASTEDSVSGTVNYNIYYDVDNTNGSPDRTGSFAFNSDTDVAVFLDNSHNKAIVTAIGTATQGGAQTNLTTRTFYRLQDPNFSSLEDGSAIPANGIVALGNYVVAEKVASNSSNTIIVQYKYGSGEWQDAANSQIPAFEALANSTYASVNQISVRTVVKEGGNAIAYSQGLTAITLARQADFDIYVEAAGSNLFYDSGRIDRDSIIIYDTVNYSDDIIFTISADDSPVSGTGEDTAGVFTYNKSTGIDLKGESELAEIINGARYITITAYSRDVKNGNFNTSATKTLYNSGYDTLIYHESFNGSVSNGTYVTNDARGVNITAGGSGSISIAADAGDKQGVSQGETGSSADIRKNSLKIAGTNNSTNEAYAQLSSNPFADELNSSLAKENGVTISFWRAIHTQNTDNRKNVPTGTLARNGIAFRRPNPTDQRGYYMIELTGNMSYAETSSNYFDILPPEYDQTQYVPSKYSGYWQHVAVTINPNAATVGEAITVYLNGIPHNLPSTIDSSGGSLSASDLINMITDSTTSICLAHDNLWQTHSDDIYLDDIRFYSKALTQKEVWNGYYDSYSDTPTVEGHLASVTHDPTTITVYKLKSATNGMAAGSLVGQEFVDYYNVPSSNYTIEYYSYGTGMQIYHSYDSVNWEIVCDSEGRVAYQNRDEFVRDNGNGTFTPMYYRDALDEVCDAVYNMASSGQKAYAGNLIWAPHVSYNLEANKWMMYVSVSFWGDAKSAIIALESFDGTPVHFLARTSSNTQAYNVLTKSNGRPNSIDPCTFYGHNDDGTINRYALYMTYGAWSEGGGLNKDLCIIQLTTDGKKTNVNSSNYPVTFANATWASSGTYICSSQPNDPNTCTGEGSFVIYHDGYYYLYTAFGVNDYNYVTRIFRSTSPTGPYVDYNGVNATNTSEYHGTQIMAPHYMVNDDYIYLSTGHDSVYKAVNNFGETVLIHSAHGRPVSNKANLDNGNYRATPDVAMITRQKDFLGNITITHPMYFTQTGWTISMPEQYNGTDTSKNIKASQIDGTYSASTLHDIIDTDLRYSSKVKPSGYTDNWDFSQKLYFSHETETTGVIYGDGQNGFMNLDYTYELSYDTENPEDSTTTYITVYNGSTEVAEGVVAMHDGVPELSYFNITEVDLNTGTPTRASTTVWSVKSGDLPEGADFTNLDEDYNRGDALLKELSTEAPKYTKSSVDALITAVDAAKANSTKSDAKKRITPVSVQSTLDNQESAIETAIANLEVAPAAVNESVMETYIEVVQKVENIINNIDSDIYDSSAFTQESITTTVSVVVSEAESSYGSYKINTIDNSATTDQIEAATAETLEFISNNYKKYKIYIEDGEDITCANDGKLVGSIESVSGKEYQYIATANSRAVFRTDKWNSAWYMSYQSTGTSRSRQYQGFGNEIALPVVGDMHVFAEQMNENNPHRVTISRTYSDKDTTAVQAVEFVDDSFELPQAPAIPFYTFNGYTYGGDTYSVGETISSISGDIEIEANYLKVESNEYAVKVSTVNGDGDIYNDSAEFNQKIVVSDSDAYAWTETIGTTTRIFFIGSEFSFFVTESATIQGITQAEFEAAGYVVPKVNLRTIGVEITNTGTKNKVLLNGNIVIPDEADIVESGILFGKATTGTINDSDLVLQNSGTQEGYKVLRAKSTRLVGANQFSISVSTTSTGEFKYRGYVIYQNENNELVTVYSNVVDSTI